MVSSSVSEVTKKEQKSLLTRFMRNSKKFLKETRKPTSKEFKQLALGHLSGIIMLGLFAYVIKVIHIPINNMIAGSEK